MEHLCPHSSFAVNTDPLASGSPSADLPTVKRIQADLTKRQLEADLGAEGCDSSRLC